MLGTHAHDGDLRSQVQQARVGLRRPKASSQMGGVTG
jgi:hypothetical protein